MKHLVILALEFNFLTVVFAINYNIGLLGLLPAPWIGIWTGTRIGK